ncbi:MAG: ATP-binding protein [Ignavibacteriae bacterium]|nr:ATP-binding protein [Ignavibacteriota bacterium]
MRKRSTFKSSTDNLSSIRDFVKSTAQQVGFSKDISGNIILAVDEAVTNVIKHAYKYSEEGKILVSISFIKNKFSVSISDKGTHFNSKLIKDPDLEEYYKQKRVGGLGMFLMKKLMDDVKYSQPQNRNKVTLIKYLR